MSDAVRKFRRAADLPARPGSIVDPGVSAPVATCSIRKNVSEVH